MASQNFDPEAVMQDGIRHAKAGRLEKSLACFNRILAVNPANAELLYTRGNLLWDLGRRDEALGSFKAAVGQAPTHADAVYNTGCLLLELGRYREALPYWRRAESLLPGAADVAHNFAATLFRLNRFEEALARYDRAVSLNPRDRAAWDSRGTILLRLDRPEEALASFDHALSLKPDSPQAHSNRASALLHLKRPEEALTCCERALALKPNYPEALNNRGTALLKLDRPEEALLVYDQALALKPDFPDPLYNRSHALIDLQRHEEALASLDRVLLLEPDRAEARYYRGLTLLQLGRFSEGWAECESRWAAGTASVLSAIYPNWTGQPLSGKSILVYHEQGFGDVIQFARYLPLLAANGADVTFLGSPATHRLLQSCGQKDSGQSCGQKDPEVPLPLHLVTELPAGQIFDFQCALMSLPLGFATTLETIPARGPYLYGDPDRVAHWRKRMGDHGLKVGLCWQGNPEHWNDRNRSIPLRQFSPLSAIPGVRLFSLQKSHGLEQHSSLSRGPTFEPLSEEFDDFADTAAAITCLDLVVTADTAVAHLAGALGRPVWVALPYAAEWRWLLGRPDSPWYPGMRLFRQTSRGDWNGVFQAIADELGQFSA